MKKARYTPIFDRKKSLQSDPNKKTALVQIRATLNRKSKFFSTEIYLDKHQWDEKRQEVKNHPNSRKLNNLIRSMINDFEDKEMDINMDFERGFRPYPFRLDDLSLEEEVDDVKLTFTEFYQNEIENDSTYSPGTKKNHKTSLNKLSEFKIPIHFSEINLEFVKAYEKFLLDYRFYRSTTDSWHPYDNNQVHFYFKSFKAIVNKAVMADYIKPNDNPFFRFKVSKYRNDKKRRAYLEPSELRRIENLKFADDEKHIEKIRDFFLISCYTGMPYGDLSLLRKEMILKKDGGYVIERLRKKNDEPFYIPLSKLFNGKPEKLLFKYINQNKSLIFEYTNQHINRTLKVISQRGKIQEKKVTSHVGRHTCASLLLSLGVGLEVIKEILGHTSIRTTEHYARMMKIRLNKVISTLDYNF